MSKITFQNCVAEWSYASGKAYHDSVNDVELDVMFTDPEGKELRVPAFWAGENTWTVRYASPVVGIHDFHTACSDVGNSDLHGRAGTLKVTPYAGTNPLLLHGPLRVAADRRHLEHRDGTPFFWLGDTWWMGFTRRLKWPEGFKELTVDRVEKGFSVIQIVAGLYPDMKPFDERGANEAGFPWDKDFSRINPAYFDMADLRVAHLVRSGLVPCIVGSWGYFMGVAGAEALKKHWRNLIARYGAYPVVWCAAGEALMGFYLDPDTEQSDPDLTALRAGWSDLVRTIRATDPYHHPVTIHPTRYGRDQVDDPSVLDIDWLQTGHSAYRTLTDTVDMLEESLAERPKMPVMVSEVNYEGIMGSNREEIQRFLFWSCMLSGAGGHTYGANGIWQVNSREEPYGPSPRGTSWGHTPWEEAYRLQGSAQLCLGKRLLERYAWRLFEPHPHWVDPHQTKDDRIGPYAAGIPGQVRVIFIPAEHSFSACTGKVTLRELEPDLEYRGFFFNPQTGAEYEIGMVAGDANGEYRLKGVPIFQDWVLVLER